MLELLVLLFTAIFLSGIITLITFLWYAAIFTLMVAITIWLIKVIIGK